MAYLKTSQIARAAGIHNNTVRLYEASGLMPPVRRSSNGYRQFTEYDRDHVILIRLAFKFTWLGGQIRTEALAVIQNSCHHDPSAALDHAARLSRLLARERLQAEQAAAYLDAWACHRDGETGATPPLQIGAASKLLDVSIDTLRNWERNGLIQVPRDPASGYRVYSEEEIGRLLVIRALRRSRYSMISIYRMFQHFDAGQRHSISNELDQLPEDEEDIFFSTDRWLSKTSELEEICQQMMAHLADMIRPDRE